MGFPSRLTHALILALYRWKGWRLEGETQVPPRCVIVGAPHTSNWDFIFFVGAAHRLGITPGFMGKHSLFRWPLARFMRDMGGVPVNRGRRGDYVEQMVRAFAQRDRLALVIAPEGTRGGTQGWRSGFYHIAHGAGVPIVPAWVCHTTRRGGVGPAIVPSGDYAADLQRIADFYRSVLPDHPRVAMITA